MASKDPDMSGSTSTAFTSVGSLFAATAEIGDEEVDGTATPNEAQQSGSAVTSSSEANTVFEKLDDDVFNKVTFIIGSKILHIRRLIFSRFVAKVLLAVFILLAIAYFCGALIHDFSAAIPLLVVMCFIIPGVLLYVIIHFMSESNKYVWKQRLQDVNRFWKRHKWIMLLVVLACFIVFVVVDARDNWSVLYSLLGVVFILLAFLISKAHHKVDWLMLLSSLVLQFLLGIVVLRWKVGLDAMDWISHQSRVLVGHTEAGSAFVFGSYGDLGFTPQHAHEIIVFALPPIIFFGGLTSLLYYFGLIQIMIRYFGYLMYFFMGAGPAEAFVAAANVFLGPNTSVLTVASFLKVMTMSELHCIMTSGFATVAGSLFGLYISLDINPTHLIAASVMSAPAALAIGKMVYPETGKSTLKNPKKITFFEPDGVCAVDAYVLGAYEGLNIFINVVACLISFVAFLGFFDATLGWFGNRVGLELSFAIITSYLFWPLPFMMGVESADCHQVARLIGTKIFLTDIVGYTELGILINNRRDGLTPIISERSEVISTYALCGFASFPDIAICLGAIGAIVPSRKGDLSKVAVRAMVAGNLACFLTASIAGLLFQPTGM